MHDNLLNQTVAGTYSDSADGLVVYFVPSAGLATGRSYTVYVSTYATLTDLIGNALPSSAVSFATGVAPQSGPLPTTIRPVSLFTATVPPE